MKSLLAAERGFSGPKRAFEDPRGFCATLSAEPKWDILKSFGSFHLKEVAFKPYPCARQLHAGVEALLSIVQGHALAPERIDAVELAVPAANASMVNRPAITATHAATVGSGQYVMAVTALRGKIDLASFNMEFLTSRAVREMMAKVKVIAGAELDRYFPKYWPGRVTVTIGGEIYSEEVIIPKGDSERPMRREEVQEKFLSLAAPIIGRDKAPSVIQEIESCERRDSLEDLLRLLRAV